MKWVKTYYEKILQSLITVGVAASVYFVVDIRDFIKYKQPYRDEMQDSNIKHIYMDICNRVNFNDSINREKIKNIHMRIDNFKYMLMQNVKQNKINDYEQDLVQK